MNSCLSCDSNKIYLLAKRKDNLDVFRCEKCNMIFVDIIGFKNAYNLTNFYEFNYFEIGRDIGYKGYSDLPISEFYWQEALIKLIENVEGKRILDVGCGMGKLLELLKKKGIDADGIEISKYAWEKGLLKGLNIRHGEIYSIDDNTKYDIITAFDLIEHIPDIYKFLNKVLTLLKDNGVFIFTTPDAEFGIKQKEKWYGFNTSLEHILYFTRENLNFLFKKYFEISPIIYNVTFDKTFNHLIGYIRKSGFIERDEKIRELFENQFNKRFAGLEDVDISVLRKKIDFYPKKAKMQSKWLVVAYYANMDGVSASHHIDDRLPYFKENGIDIYLLSSQEGLRYTDICHIQVPFLLLTPAAMKSYIRDFLKKKIKNKFLRGVLNSIIFFPIFPFYLIEKLLVQILCGIKVDNTWSWCLPASLIGTWLVITKSPSLLYTSGSTINVHLTGLIISYLTKIPWIAEFQDPLIHQHPQRTQRGKRFIQWLEKAICRQANKIIFLTNAARDNTARRIGDSSKLVTIYPGANPHYFSKLRKTNTSDIFNISYFGSLWGTRNLEYFLCGLETLLDNCPHLVDLLRVNIYGNILEKKLEDHIYNFKYKNVVKFLGKLNREDALRAMSESTLLLLIQHRDKVSSETIPLKVYEYLHSGVPIFALVYKNLELKELLEELGHTVVQADDKEAIKNGIEMYVRRWEKDKLQSVALKKSPYSVSNAVERIISLADNIITNT